MRKSLPIPEAILNKLPVSKTRSKGRAAQRFPQPRPASLSDGGEIRNERVNGLKIPSLTGRMQGILELSSGLPKGSCGVRLL